MYLLVPTHMWEAREPQSIIQAAEKAAAAGSCTSAEKLLREAARLTVPWQGRMPVYAAVLNGEIPLDQAAQTMRWLGLVALGIGQEQAQRTDEALASYRRYLAENALGDPVAQYFALWRIRVLSRTQ